MSRLSILLAALLIAAPAYAHEGGVAEEPYRYSGQGEPAPFIATQTISLPGTEDVITVASREEDPQVTIFLPGTAITAAGPTATISAQPQTPSGAPKEATIAGNVYRVTATSPSGPVTIRNGPVAIALRLPQEFPLEQTPEMYFREPGGEWRSLLTHQTGGDVFQAGFAGVGEYVLAVPKAAQATPAPVKSLDWRIFTSATAAILVVVLGMLLALYMRYRRRQG
jgi:hypothetical protein